MRLLPGLLPLWRGTQECQVGADPRLAFRLTGLDACEHRLLDSLAAGTVHGSQRHELARLARQHGVPLPRATRLLDHLRSRGVLREEPVIADPDRGEDPDPVRAARVAGDDAASVHATLLALAAGSEAERLVEHRRGAGVAITGGGGLGLDLAQQLVQAGVGAVWLDDDGPVGVADVSRGGYRPTDVGRSRATASRALLRAVNPRVGGPRPRPDLVVLVEERVAVPFRSSGLQREDIAHLSVVPRELDAVVGPLVVPGRGACLRCLDLRRCAADPAWPTVATQLAVAGPSQLPWYVQRAAAAVATAEVLAHLDGREVTLASVTVEVGLAGIGVRRRWRAHPDCGCQAGE